MTSEEPILQNLCDVELVPFISSGYGGLIALTHKGDAVLKLTSGLAQALGMALISIAAQLDAQSNMVKNLVSAGHSEDTAVALATSLEDAQDTDNNQQPKPN